MTFVVTMIMMVIQSVAIKKTITGLQNSACCGVFLYCKLLFNEAKWSSDLLYKAMLIIDIKDNHAMPSITQAIMNY